MEKGKIIWILYNNCLYCSEISEMCIFKIGWTDGLIEEYKTHIDLVPIVGDINKIILRKGQDCTKRVVIAWVYGGKQHVPYPGAQISCDFDLISDILKTNDNINCK